MVVSTAGGWRPTSTFWAMRAACSSAACASLGSRAFTRATTTDAVGATAAQACCTHTKISFNSCRDISLCRCRLLRVPPVQREYKEERLSRPLDSDVSVAPGEVAAAVIGPFACLDV